MITRSDRPLRGGLSVKNSLERTREGESAKLMQWRARRSAQQLDGACHMIRKWRIAVWSASLVAVAGVVYSLGIAEYRKANPASAFTALVGTPVPAGVRVTRYESAVTDNFFHTTHFWVLEGDADALRMIARGPSFVRSDEDASSVLPEAANQLGMTLSFTDLAEGYESEDSHNRWLLILKTQQRAIYVL